MPLPMLNHSSPTPPRAGTAQRVLLIRPPFFTPMTPPLGIALLKASLERHGHHVRCLDFDIDPELWGTHHQYFGILTAHEGRQLNDGYSKLWNLLNAHTQAYVAGGDRLGCARVLRALAPLYDVQLDDRRIDALHALIERLYHRLAAFLDAIDLSSYGFVGTSTYSTSLGPSLFLLRRVKERHPSIRTIMGGGVFADDLALGSTNLDVLLRECGFVDHVVIGEGELLLLRLLDGTLHDRRLIQLPDLGGETLAVNDLPIPDFGDFPLDSYMHLSVEGGRSCPFQCSFCSETIQWGDYRKKSKEVLADQMTSLARRYGNRTFFMGDSIMNPYLPGLSSHLLSSGGTVQYDGYLRADKSVANLAGVTQWARSGLFRVRLGLETASGRLLTRMDKKTTPDVMSKVLQTLSDAGIRTTTYWIVGYQGETEQDFLETLAFIREHHRYIYELEAHPYYYYPYGQVASRLFASVPICPPEVRDLLKFDLWEIEGADPDRAERFRRLRRLSQLASSLELPNIYTLADRYRAEKRWLSLWPSAAAV